MNLENSLLKVLTIWIETFKNTRDPLTEKQKIAFIMHPDTEKLSYYSEEVLRLGMKKAFIQDTSKLNDIYLIVHEVNKQVNEKKANFKQTG